jgi:DNA replication protein DnaC
MTRSAAAPRITRGRRSPVARNPSRTNGIAPTAVTLWLHHNVDDITALFVKALELFRNLATARADGSHSKALYQLTKGDLLVVDDWAMAPMSDPERRDFLEICDGRYQKRATLLASQMPVEAWHKQIGDPTIADSILDRLVHNGHRNILSGESLLHYENASVAPLRN